MEKSLFKIRICAFINQMMVEELVLGDFHSYSKSSQIKEKKGNVVKRERPSESVLTTTSTSKKDLDDIKAMQMNMLGLLNNVVQMNASMMYQINMLGNGAVVNSQNSLRDERKEVEDPEKKLRECMQQLNELYHKLGQDRGRKFLKICREGKEEMMETMKEVSHLILEENKSSFECYNKNCPNEREKRAFEELSDWAYDEIGFGNYM